MAEARRSDDGVVASNYPDRSREERYEITAERTSSCRSRTCGPNPVVMKAAREGKLHLHAWFFEIGTGTVFRYSPEKEQFEPIREEEG